MKVQLVNPWGDMVHLTSVPSEGRTLLRWFPRVPLAISYEGRAYGDTGLYSMGYRVYREGWRVPEISTLSTKETEL
jgi:hypothetical protein